MITTFIYILLDPFTFEVRYVGKTVNPKERLWNHCKEKSNCHRSRWIQKVIRKGRRPIMWIVEEMRGEWPWQDSERFWIEYAKRHGCRLTNNTSGGDGVPDLPPETRERMRRVWLGRKHQPESLLKIGAASRNRIPGVETRAKMSAAHKGRKITWIAKIAEVNRKLKPDQMATIRRRLKAKEKVKDLAKEYGVHRTTLSKVKLGTYLRLRQC